MASRQGNSMNGVGRHNVATRRAVTQDDTLRTAQPCSSNYIDSWASSLGSPLISRQTLKYRVNGPDLVCGARRVESRMSLNVKAVTLYSFVDARLHPNYCVPQ